MFNPGVELAAYLVHWSPVHSEASQLGWKAIEKAIDHLMSQSEMGQHEINNYQQMVKLMKLRESEFNHQIQYSLNQVLEKVILLAEQCVDRDVSSWSTGYKALPLDFVDSPEDPLCNQFGHLVEQNLDFYIHQLSQEGTWDISWSWDSYPEEFAVARRDWKGILAVRRYKILKSFGYLEY
ncbi:hypothetical protein [Rubeoparvulum massiliense]|uniref:hypothetical protein n=1 Tax=Rubeoparvulum massiliense TaxID=1631346 RepID=UPI00065DF7F9|nr:hypothetical protein [Rubeoparvulum massiliense]